MSFLISGHVENYGRNSMTKLSIYVRLTAYIEQELVIDVVF
jgi:hypothetical protein